MFIKLILIIILTTCFLSFIKNIVKFLTKSKKVLDNNTLIKCNTCGVYHTQENNHNCDNKKN